MTASADEAEDPNRLSWWLPRIEAAGVPTPRTTIVEMTDAERDEIRAGFSVRGFVAPDGLRDRVCLAAAALGWPAFLRTDHLAAKHGWGRTCFLSGPDVVAGNIMELVASTEEVDWFRSMPWTTLAVREYLPVVPVGFCRRWNDLPVVREFRFFVDDGAVRCHHPHWPDQALADGGAEFLPGHDHDAFSRLDEGELSTLVPMVEAAGRAVGGSMSVDVLWTRRGWFATDMAPARESHHDPSLPCAHDSPLHGREPAPPFDPASLLMDAPKEG